MSNYRNNSGGRYEERQRGRGQYDGPPQHTIGTAYESDAPNGKTIFRGPIDGEKALQMIEQALNETQVRGSVVLSVKRSNFGQQGFYFAVHGRVPSGNGGQQQQRRYGNGGGSYQQPQQQQQWEQYEDDPSGSDQQEEYQGDGVDEQVDGAGMEGEAEQQATRSGPRSSATRQASPRPQRSAPQRNGARTQAAPSPRAATNGKGKATPQAAKSTARPAAKRATSGKVKWED